MSKLTTELKAAAASARAFADSIGSPELKRAFREMAGRWEAEADEHERDEPSETPGTSARPKAFHDTAPAWKKH